MTEEQKDQLRLKWKSWLDQIGNELGWLLSGRDFFWRLQDIVESNEMIQSPAILHNWIADNYVAKITTGIIKITDHYKGTISLYWLILGIKKNPDVITRDYFVSQWRDEYSKKLGVAEKTFNTFAKPGEQHIDQEGLESDIQMLSDGTNLIKNFRDKWVAHFDEKRKTDQMPTFGDLDTALDTIDKAWCKYNLLLTRSNPPTRKPAPTSDWDEPLRHAWIDTTKKEEG